METNRPDRAALRALMMEEFSRHRSTMRGPDDPRWVCKCGVEVPTNERGYPLGREHVVDRLLNVILAEDADLSERLADAGPHPIIDHPA